MKIKKRYLIGIIGTTMFVGFVTYATVQTIPEENIALASEQEITEDTPLIIDDNANNNLPIKLSGLNTFYPKKVQTPVHQAPLTTEALTMEEVPIVVPEPKPVPEVIYEEEEDGDEKYSDDSKYENENEDEDEREDYDN